MPGLIFQGFLEGRREEQIQKGRPYSRNKDKDKKHMTKEKSYSLEEKNLGMS